MVGKELMGIKVYRNDSNIVNKMTELNVKTLLISPLKQKALANNPVMADQLIEAGISILIMNTTTEWDGKSDISTNQLKEIEIEELMINITHFMTISIYVVLLMENQEVKTFIEDII